MRGLYCVTLLLALQVFGNKEYQFDLDSTGTVNKPTKLEETLSGSEKISLKLEFTSGTAWIWIVDAQTDGLDVTQGDAILNSNLEGAHGYQVWYVSCKSKNCENQEVNFIYVESFKYEHGNYNGDENYLVIEINKDDSDNGLILGLCAFLLSFLFLI